MRFNIFCLLAIIALTFGAANGKPIFPDAPAGSIVAVAKLASLNTSSTTRGSVALIWPRIGKGNATVQVNITGGLEKITMAHIHMNGTGNPIRLDLLPLLNGTKPVLLNPPLSFRGIFSFTTEFDYLRVAAWDPDSNFMNTINLLQQGLLYVNVHTVALPGGALQGKLICKEPCFFAVCNPSPGRPC